MRPRWLGLIPLALCAFSPALLPVVTPSLAHAAGDGPATAVLGLESSDVPASVVDAISEELRQRVSAASDMRLVSGKDLVELKLVFSCADEGHACMAQAGKSLDADRLIYGSVKKDGNDVAVWLKSFDVHHERVDNWLTDKLPGKQTDADGIRTAVARWFAKLTGHPTNVGTILVSANTLGAVVTLDGVPAGVTSDQPLAIPDVKPGAHHLLLTKVGSAPARQDLAVQAGQTLTVNLALHPEGMAVVAGSEAGGTIRKSAAGAEGSGGLPGTDDGRAGYRTGFWVTLGAGLVSAGAAVKFGLDVLKINKDLDPFRRGPCRADPAMSCDSMGKVAPPLSDQERKTRDDKLAEGQRDRNLQWVFIGVGSALGITSAYLLYKGYLDADDAPTHREAMSGLRIFPTAGMSSGGVQAEFDF